MELEEKVKVVKCIAKAVVAVIEAFEQGGKSMNIIKFAKVACNVIGGVISIVSVLKD